MTGSVRSREIPLGIKYKKEMLSAMIVSQITQTFCFAIHSSASSLYPSRHRLNGGLRRFRSQRCSI